MPEEKTPEEKARAKRVHGYIMLVCGAIFLIASGAAAYLGFSGPIHVPAGLRRLFRASESPPALPSLESFPVERGSKLRRRRWSGAAFAEAQRRGTLVLLDLSPRWGHWCHLMEAQTYGDPAVARWLEDNVVLVREDPQARPDLAARYLSRLPTSALLLPSGELLSAAAYAPPERFLAWARQVVDSYRRSREKIEAARENSLRESARRKELLLGDAADAAWKAKSDAERRDVLERSVSRAVAAAQALERRAPLFLRPQSVYLLREAGRGGSLGGAARLEDPAWGGFYRYSACADWNCPAFEKTLSGQAAAIELFGTAEGPVSAAAAARAAGFVERFLRTGAGYADSMDSDVQKDGRWIDGARYFALPAPERERLGLPALDRSVYTGANAELAAAYLTLGERLRQPRWKTAGLKIVGLLERRIRPDGGIRHAGSGELAGLAEDQRAAARAELAAFEATGRRAHLAAASRLLAYASRDWRRTPDPDGVVLGGILLEEYARLANDAGAAERSRAMLEWAAARPDSVDPVLLGRAALRLKTAYR